jgi:hypothetical protein
VAGKAIPPLKALSEERLVQRWVMATLFAVDYESWDVLMVAGNPDVCSWFGVACDNRVAL